MSSILNQLEVLRDNYRQGLSAKIANIREQWMLACSTDLEQDRQTLYRMVHSLAGSAGTYGVTALSECAREFERKIQEWHGQGTLFSEQHALLSNQYIQRMQTLSAGGDVSPSVVPNAVVGDGLIERAPIVSTILVTDDDYDSRALLVTILRAMGHTVLEASSGEEGVDCFQRARPDIVLMDIVMPGITGYEATQKIKQIAGETFVPVIFLTAVTDDQMLAKCVAVGGDNFLTKPYNTIILGAEIQALLRIRNLHRQLEQYKQENEKEIAEAKHVFKALFDNTNQLLPNVRAWNLPATNFSGDTPLFRTTPDGRLHVLLADFTGHGLAPAVGTVMAAEIFHDLSEQGARMEDILVAINNKFTSHLPTGRFCAAALLAVEPEEARIRVWNCGLPDILVLKHAGDTPDRLTSTHLPLGVIPLEHAPLHAELDLQSQSFVLYTDGLIEARNQTDELFGAQRLEACIKSQRDLDDILPKVQQEVLQWIGATERADDVTVLVVRP